jgi:hypothetical protein
MPVIDPPDDPHFTYDNMPRYDGPGRAREYEPDCCANRECEERDYNRACLLTLQRMSQAYAALHLLAWNSSRLWSCDEEGHTRDCSNPECRFGQDMSEALRQVRVRFTRTVIELCKTLTVPATNLEAQWQEFFDAEQAGVGLVTICERLERGQVPYRSAKRLADSCIETWKQQIVDGDPLEYARWFEPPAVPDGPPS